MKKDKLTLKEIEAMTPKQFVKYAKEVIALHKPVHPHGLSLEFPYDLRRSMDMKIKDSSDWAKWTAFVNNAGTLCHVICPEAEILIRLRYSYPIKHLHVDRMRQAVAVRIEPWVKI